MASHTLQSLMEVKHRLEKLISTDDLQNNEENVTDCLKLLEDFTMTSDLITQSGLGHVIASVREKYHKTNEKISHKCQDILAHWKNIKKSSKPVLQKSPEPKSGDVPSKTSPNTDQETNKKKLLQESAKLSFKTVMESKLEDPILNDKRKFSLTPTRRSIVNIFVNSFKSEVSIAAADRIGLNIEEEISNLLGSESKEYIAKAKMLSASIKLNAVSPIYPCDYYFFDSFVFFVFAGFKRANQEK
jgi:hypothetical protein